MSHIVQIQTQVRDPVAIAAACTRLNLQSPVHQTVKLFDGTYTGYCVQLPKWRYPIVCDTTAATIKYDNFNGHWGQPQELDKFLQAYAIEQAKIVARRQGHTVLEQPLTNGSVKLTIQVQGGAA
jgi:hypothetical protein